MTEKSVSSDHVNDMANFDIIEDANLNEGSSRTNVNEDLFPKIPDPIAIRGVGQLTL